MKVELDGERVSAVGKLLPAQQTSAESIGLLFFRGDGADLFRENLETEMRSGKGLKSWFLLVIDSLARQSMVRACSISGLKWCEIDFLEDLETAQSVFS